MFSAKKLTSEKIHRVTTRVAMYLIRDMKPFSTVESKNFRGIVHELEPRYRFPNRDTFAEDVLPASYEIVKNRVRKEISGYCGITCDAWTSCGGDSYITITAHTVDENFSLNNIVLDVAYERSPHWTKHS